MGRRLRASKGDRSPRKASAVSTRMALPGKGWSLPQAAHMLEQGYTEDHVEATTGFDIRIVKGYARRQGK